VKPKPLRNGLHKTRRFALLLEVFPGMPGRYPPAKLARELRIRDIRSNRRLFIGAEPVVHELLGLVICHSVAFLHGFRSIYLSRLLKPEFKHHIAQNG
jgi:hypothetical protein